MKFLIFLCLFLSSTSSLARIIEHTRAVIDDQMVLKTEIDDFENKIKSESLINQNLISLSGLNSKPSKEEILDYLILKKILVLKSSKEKGGVSLSDLAEKEIKTLASQNNISKAQLQKEIESRGIDFNDYRNFIGESSLIRDTIERNVISQVRPSEEDFVSFLKRNNIDNIQSTFAFNLDQIFISKSIQSETKLLNQINADNFKTFFNNPETYKIDALSLGNLKFKDLSKRHQKAIKDLNNGELSAPIKEDNGYRLFYVNSKNTSYNIPNTPLVQSKQKEFYDNLVKRQFANWTASIKEDFFIRINK